MRHLKAVDLRLGRHRGRPWLAGADGRVRRGVRATSASTITIDEARGPMGMAKRPHIAALMALPRVAEAWTSKHGRGADRCRHRRRLRGVRADEHRGGSATTPTSSRALPMRSRALRARGLKIGSTTGYTRDIMAEILPVAAAPGL